MVWSNKGTTYRSTVMGTRGMVASAHPLSSLAGIQMLQQGGSAVDAIVAMCAALDVVEPYMSGLGGGGAMIIQPADGETRTLFYGGGFPATANLDTLDATSVDIGPKASTLPAAAMGWFAAHDEYGQLDRETLLGPAIGYARAGVGLTVKNSDFYNAGRSRLNDHGLSIFFPDDGNSPAGTVIKQPQLAETYEAIARDGVDVLYDGPVGEELVRSIQQAGGLITAEDLQSTSVEWGTPSVTSYRGRTVKSTPWPLTAYEMQLNLNIMEGFDLGASGHNSAETLHTIVESMKLSMTERSRYAGDTTPPPGGLLSKSYADHRRKLIDPKYAKPIASERGTRMFPPDTIQPGSPEDYIRECTTHLSAIDSEGNAVAITQSLGAAFGSGFVAGSTGITMNNYLYFFDVDPGSPNAIGPDTTWALPLMPTMIFDDEKLFLIIGTPGAFGIPHTTTQMISNVIDHGFGVQAAIEAPRLRLFSGNRLVLENRVDESVMAELRSRGHEIETIDAFSPAVGGGQGILIDPETGAYSGGGDPRRDGTALGY
ncbi:MAG: gamma-glutamyltransferase family protein [Thermomicrobiales bacterium]